MSRRINEIILALYLSLACISTVYLYVTRTVWQVCLILVAMIVVFWIVSHFLLGWLGRIRPGAGQSVSWKEILLVTLICFGYLMIWYAAFRPGLFQEDNINQYGQAASGVYDSWHPVWHTLICFTLPVRITGGVWGIVLFQSMYFSAVFGYMYAVICRHAGRIAGAAVLAFLLLNPYVGFILMYPFKDVAFAAAGGVAMCMASEIYFSRGEWASKPYRCILMGVMLANATLFRYNGIIFTAALLLVLVFYVSRRAWIYIALSFAALMLIVRVPVYRVVDAAESPVEVIQSVGFPMAIIGNVTKETPELLDDETRDFVYSLSLPEVWEERYQRGDFNLMKYGGIYNPEVIEETGAANIVKMAIRCVRVSPQASFEAVFSLTDFVYGLDVRDKADYDVVRQIVVDNDYGIVHEGNEALAGFLLKYAYVMKMRGFNLIRKLSFLILAVIASALARFEWNRWTSWKRILLCVPILAYDFGTMLLLSGHDSRFFFISYMVCPICVLMMLGRNPDETDSPGHDVAPAASAGNLKPTHG